VSSLWSPLPSSGSQSEYEALRQEVLSTGSTPKTLGAARFMRQGLAGLISWRSLETAFVGELIGAVRPPWAPHDDPRLSVLAESFGLLLTAQLPYEIRESVR
jgi:hypothetical protein